MPSSFLAQMVDSNLILLSVKLISFSLSLSDVIGSGPDHHEGIRRERLASIDQPSSAEVQRRKKKKKRKTKLERQSTLIRREVESLPTFWPIFIILLSIGQVSLSL